LVEQAPGRVSEWLSTCFFDKLEKDGYTTEDGINGLIDIDEM
jgi:hypothetical protein